jgi:hypothetical protein
VHNHFLENRAIFGRIYTFAATFQTLNQHIMKKVFAFLVLAGLLTACNNKAKTTEEKKDSVTNTNTVTPPADNNTATTPPASSDIPSFTDPDVQKWVNDYTTYVTTYVAAYTSKDPVKIAAVSSQVQQWGQQTAGVLTKLAGKPDEAKKLNDYLQALANRMNEAVKGMN